MNVTYSEGHHIGYRYYDLKNIKPKYEFGFGLSYTNFTYSNLNLTCFYVDENDCKTGNAVKVDRKNYKGENKYLPKLQV